MRVSDGWIYTNPDNGEPVPVYGTPGDGAAIWNPRHDTATEHRYTTHAIHPNGIHEVESRRFDH